MTRLGRSLWHTVEAALLITLAACRSAPLEPTPEPATTRQALSRTAAPPPSGSVARSAPSPAAPAPPSQTPPSQTPPSQTPPSQTPPTSQPAQTGQTGQPWQFAAAERVIAIGDLHGDLEATRSALRLGGAIDKNSHWVGGKLVLVQAGDQLDRGDDERAILDLLDALTREAKRAGGAVHVLNGNHELMNVLGDFRYVTPHGFIAFADVPPMGRAAQLAPGFPLEQRGRAAAFLPGGPFALKLAERNTVVMVGDTVFVHGALLPEHVKRGVGLINEELRQFMRGDLKTTPPSALDEESPVWSRRYSQGDPGAIACAELSQVLKQLGASRMVVGHTPQKSGITSACDQKIWRIDTGMARAYGGNATALEIKQGKITPLTAPPSVH